MLDYRTSSHQHSAHMGARGHGAAQVMIPGRFRVVVTWASGIQETASDHGELGLAATEAFRLAKRLSEPDSTDRAIKVALYDSERLELSIATLPGASLLS